MNKIIHLFVFLTAIMLTSCYGMEDGSSLPVLEPSVAELDLAEDDQVSFRVIYDGSDVTSDSRIICVNDASVLSQASYTPLQPGVYEFEATYMGRTSERVAVSVINSSPQVNSRYNKNVCLMEFTGAWCTWCPEGYSNINMILQTNQLWKTKVHMMALHTDVGGVDELSIQLTKDIIQLYNDGEVSYPCFLVDMQEFGESTNAGGMTLFQEALNNSFEKYTPHCGVSVSSVLDRASSMAEITVKVTSELTTSYRVAVFIVEDRVKYYQLDGSLTRYDYNHRHVTRKSVTSYSKSFAGEKITDDGIIEEGKEVVKSWKTGYDLSWNPDNTKVYAIVMDSKGRVNNMNLCYVDGGDSGYDYK